MVITSSAAPGHLLAVSVAVVWLFTTDVSEPVTITATAIVKAMIMTVAISVEIPFVFPVAGTIFFPAKFLLKDISFTLFFYIHFVFY